MANEKRLMRVEDFKKNLCHYCNTYMSEEPCEPSECWVHDVIAQTDTVDAVSRGVHDQVRWERDVAIGQLESYGISLGEKADAVKVVRCKDCKHREDGLCTLESVYDYPWYYTQDDDFCSYGERREGE